MQATRFKLACAICKLAVFVIHSTLNILLDLHKRSTGLVSLVGGLSPSSFLKTTFAVPLWKVQGKSCHFTGHNPARKFSITSKSRGILDLGKRQFSDIECSKRGVHLLDGGQVHHQGLPQSLDKQLQPKVGTCSLATFLT